MTAAVRNLSLNHVRTDGGTQVRDALDDAWIAELRALYLDDMPIDPMVVVIDASRVAWLVDGFHRYNALVQLGRAAADVVVHEGDLERAKFLAGGANRHGRPLTPGEKRRAVLLARSTTEGKRMGVRELARHCGVSKSWVQTVLEAEVSGPDTDLSHLDDRSSPTPVGGHLADVHARADAVIRANPKAPTAWLAEEAHCHDQTIVARRKVLGFAPPSRSEASKARWSAHREAVVADLRANPGEKTLRATADRTGASPTMVAMVRKELGLPPCTRGGRRVPARADAPPGPPSDDKNVGGRAAVSRRATGVDPWLVAELQRLEAATPAQREALLAAAAERWPTGRAPVLDVRHMVDPDGDFWSQLKAIVAAHLDAVLADSDEPERQRLVGRFGADIKAAIADVRDAVRRRRDAGGLASLRTRARRAEVVEACGLLAIELPKRGAPVDIDAARKARKRMARVYHPDANGGSDANREQFDAVMAAFRLIETYNEELSNAGASNGVAAHV